MRYAYHDLGQQQEGSTVVVQLRGSAANVLVLDAENFSCYQAGKPFLYEGGHYRRPRVQLEIPHDGHWFAVVDLGGYKGRVHASVDVLTPDGSQAHSDSQDTFVEART